MITQKDFVRITDYIWEIPKQYRSDMLVPARIFATEKMIPDLLRDRSLEQLINVATLPGIQGYALAMPDAHEGYGFPIGGVAAMQYPDGIISPGGIGYDINCGVRLMQSQITIHDIKPHLEKLSQALFHHIPSGVGQGGSLKLSTPELNTVLEQGAEWTLKNNFATSSDIAHIESHGKLDNADQHEVSDEAKKRGFDQLGTIGSGNHFVEVDFIDEIFDTHAASALGLWKDQIVILIHCGSRGLGHQVATDHIKIMMQSMKKYNITLPDRELACVPFSSPEGSAYYNAMAAAANFAWANRQYISWEVREAWKQILGDSGGDLSLVYDVAHNIAKIETHEINDRKQKLIMHRKGATRAFGPNHPELIQQFKSVGQPVLIPGSMGTASYVLTGTTQGEKTSFSSSCHGAGRVLSRSAAKRQVHGKTLHNELLQAGIYIQTDSFVGLAEEAPQAYKDIHDVVDIVHEAGIAKKVARMRPCAVIKG